ncbi:hypothetical protein V7S43_005169 [Phytophthora oleae]|uniref:Uncharacterized protein n=1 Tax=Phytophthora oleae TaxID=2107226 RepID=A0ABD3FVM3_9STRA
MSFAELESTTVAVAELCRRSFGPCGEEILLFRPAEAPVVTGEGHAVLTAWNRELDGDSPLTRFLLTAANGVHQQLGDGSSEFILLVDAVVRHAADRLRRAQDVRHAVERARLSRAFGMLKWEIQREMQTPRHGLCGLQLSVPIELDYQTMQPSLEFRAACTNVLVSALRGVLGEQAVDFVADLVLKWVFTQCQISQQFDAEKLDKPLFKRVQQYLKCAPDAVIFMAAPSVFASYVVPNDEFILKKSVVTSQPPGMLDQCRGTVRFVCFTCSLSLSAGSNNIELATSTEEELFTAQDAAHLFISKFVRFLRDRQQVQFIVSTEALDENVVAACTRQDIACVQLAEPEDVDALCISAGIFPLASVFDEIREVKHIGECINGISRVRFQQQACLRLRGFSSKLQNKKINCERRTEDFAVPQLLVHAPTKGVYKQYYAAIVKSLRVLRSWWEPMPAGNDTVNTSQQSVAYTCRGGGATELAVARWLQDEHAKFCGDIPQHDPVVFYLARKLFANALIEVVSILRNNLSEIGGDEKNSIGNQRQVLLDALKVDDQPQEYCGYTLDYSRVIETLAGSIQIPELVMGDPATYGLVHPWRRIDTLLFLVLQTLEQIFRIDQFP